MKVYVGNLPFSVDNDKLNEIFSGFGEIEEATVIMNKFSGRSKGFGFVTFKDDESAKKAISEMNDKEVEGRRLKVNEAKPMDPDRPRPPRRDFGNRGGGFGGGGGRRFGGGNRDRF
ncbi:MAG: RNA-binding protein [Nanoarchaeota archaeon]